MTSPTGGSPASRLSFPPFTVEKRDQTLVYEEKVRGGIEASLFSHCSDDQRPDVLEKRGVGHLSERFSSNSARETR